MKGSNADPQKENREGMANPSETDSQTTLSRELVALITEAALLRK